MARRWFGVFARVAPCGLALLFGWGCATAPAPEAPTAATPPASAPQPLPPAGSSVTVPPGQPPSTAAMVASAQWIQEASRAIDVGDYDRATSLLERAVSLEPNNGRAYHYYGLAMAGRGRPGAALSLFQKAEILLRGDAQALGETYAQMGASLERLGRRPEAVRRYQQALAQDPSNALARRRIEALRG